MAAQTCIEFKQLAQKVFGYGWQSKLAKTFKVNVRTVRRWKTGENRVPDSVIIALNIMGINNNNKKRKD